jgi:RimJ/RimL family protein N-acetyltransferase
MTTVRKTDDIDLIKRIFTEPENYYCLVDDGSASIEDFEPLINEGITYLALGEEQGIVMYYPTNHSSFDIHICMTTLCRGRDAIELGKESISWIFENTSAMKINARVPTCNTKVFHYAVSVGFEQEGIDVQGFMKDGILYDQFILGITRDKSCHQQQ